MFEWVGWVATAVFASSYFFKHNSTLRQIQAGAALLWIGYGVIIHSLPVIVANLIVAVAAMVTYWRQRSSEASVFAVKSEGESD